VLLRRGKVSLLAAERLFLSEIRIIAVGIEVGFSIFVVHSTLGRRFAIIVVIVFVLERRFVVGLLVFEVISVNFFVLEIIWTITVVLISLFMELAYNTMKA
jgi:hypothetical protein